MNTEWAPAVTPEALDAARAAFDVAFTPAQNAVLLERLRDALEAATPLIVAEHDRLMQEQADARFRARTASRFALRDQGAET